MGTVILSAYVIITGVIGLVILRNTAVSRYRRNILTQLEVACLDDIHNGRDWVWRLDYYDTVSYDDMMRKFWQSLGSFYPDQAFITSGTSMPSCR